MCIAACNVQRINHSFAEAAATSAIKKYELNTPNQMSAEKQLELASKLSEATTASTRLTVENESLKAQIDKKDAEIQADKVTSYRSTSYELRVTSYELRVTSYKLQVTSYKLQVTSYKLQASHTQALEGRLTAALERATRYQDKLAAEGQEKAKFQAESEQKAVMVGMMTEASAAHLAHLA